jgi:hypothetical protein
VEKLSALLFPDEHAQSLEDEAPSPKSASSGNVLEPEPEEPAAKAAGKQVVRVTSASEETAQISETLATEIAQMDIDARREVRGPV